MKNVLFGLAVGVVVGYVLRRMEDRGVRSPDIRTVLDLPSCEEKSKGRGRHG